MPLPSHLQDAVDEGRDLRSYYDSLTPESIAAQQLSVLTEYVSNYIRYHLASAIRAREANGSNEIRFDIPGADTGVQSLITDPIEAIEGINVSVESNPSGSGDDTLVITWPGAV